MHLCPQWYIFKIGSRCWTISDCFHKYLSDYLYIFVSKHLAPTFMAQWKLKIFYGSRVYGVWTELSQTVANEFNEWEEANVNRFRLIDWITYPHKVFIGLDRGLVNFPTYQFLRTNFFGAPRYDIAVVPFRSATGEQVNRSPRPSDDEVDMCHSVAVRQHDCDCVGNHLDNLINLILRYLSVVMENQVSYRGLSDSATQHDVLWVWHLHVRPKWNHSTPNDVRQF